MSSKLSPTGVPSLQLGHPLARRLLFATLAWEPGFRDLGTDLVLRDSVRSRYGIVTAGANLNYVRNRFGRAIENATGGGNNDIAWNEINGSYATTRSLTAFLVLKPLATNSPALSAFFRKKNTATTDPGWKFDTTGNPDLWLTRVGNGASTAAATSITASSLTKHFVIGMRADVERAFISIWVDGRKEAQSALAFVPGNDGAQPLSLFQAFEGQINVAALWNRPLSDGEMVRLFLDPYMLWRRPFNNRGSAMLLSQWQGSQPARLLKIPSVVAAGTVPGNAVT